MQVTSVVRASDRSFQVKWIESAYERGSLAGTSHWTAILTIVVKPPASAETLRRNPLGLYVDAIDWAREVEPGRVRLGCAAGARPATQSRRFHSAGSPLDPGERAPATRRIRNECLDQRLVTCPRHCRRGRACAREPSACPSGTDGQSRNGTRTECPDAVGSANRGATLEPTGTGFVNAVQVYPWSEGALYRLFTAPGLSATSRFSPARASSRSPPAIRRDG